MVNNMKDVTGEYGTKFRRVWKLSMIRRIDGRRWRDGPELEAEPQKSHHSALPCQPSYLSQKTVHSGMNDLEL